MIEKIIEKSANNKFLVFLIVAFLIVGGLWAIATIPLDAIPDLSDAQVIVFTEWKGRSPDLVEDQITYPLVTTLLSAPKVRVVRGYSMFGMSFVYAIFEDGTDIYWARSRVLEYMQSVLGKLPPGVTPVLGPDATGVGWGFQYALVDESGTHTLQEMRSFQDWYLRYWLQSVEGVSEVASVGGYEKQYQINLDPNKLLAYNMQVSQIIEMIRKNNNDVGGRVVEFSGKEFFIRGRGYIQSTKELEQISLGSTAEGTPILLKDVATVKLGPEIRRGAADLDGKGEVVSGIVVVRFGENVLKVIDRVKEKIKQVQPGFPEGLKLVPVYDRSDLIMRSVNNLKRTLIEEMIIVLLVIMIFLLHFRSGLIAIIVLPIAVLISFIPMKFLGISSNIMSLGGIAIAIGAMVDAVCVLVENAHKKLEDLPPDQDRKQVIIAAAKEVGKPIFFSLLIITVSFLPVFTLVAQEGRLFRPLAFTKTFAMFFAALLSVTLAPALMVILIRKGKIWKESKHPISRFLHKIYDPFVKFALKFRWTVILSSILILASTIIPFSKIGSEFMPPLNEGAILYMPVTLPGIAINEATKIMQTQDKILKSFPEVETVLGKAGRAQTPTDPAPLSMFETTVTLKPEKEWRDIELKRWYNRLGLSGFFQTFFSRMWPQKRKISYEELIDEMDKKLKFPGVTNAWTMPIRNRIDMLTTGIRTPVGIKVFGPDLKEIENIGMHLEMILNKVPGTRSVFAERVTGGYFLDITPKREEIARYNLSVKDVEDLIETAIGGMNIDVTIEGRERYVINVRYARELRDDVDKIKRVLVPTPAGAQVPLGQLADIKLSTGPDMIKDEDGSLTGWVYVDIAGRDIGGYVRDAKKAVEEEMKLPAGYTLHWTGQYEYMERVKKRLWVVVPLTLAIIIIMLYLNFKSIPETLIVLLSVPFALTGSYWFLYMLGYNMSIAVWVGMIALAGIAAETGIVMIVFLDEAYNRFVREGRMKTKEDLFEAIKYGAVQRVRPKLMTVLTTILGLVPIMWAHGVGADTAQRIAAPMIGGLISSTVLTLIIIPAIYAIWKWNFEVNRQTFSSNVN